MASLNLGHVVGAAGVGVPAGGAAGQILRKVSDTDFAAEWGSEVDTLWTGSLDAVGGTAVLAKAYSGYRFLVFRISGSFAWARPSSSGSVVAPTLYTSGSSELLRFDAFAYTIDSTGKVLTITQANRIVGTTVSGSPSAIAAIFGIKE